MSAALPYSLLRALLDVLATSRGDQAQLRAEVLALRQQVQVLERQIKRVRWTPGGRMLMALTIGMGRSTCATGNRARLASSLGSPQVGRVPQATNAGKTADLD